MTGRGLEIRVGFVVVLAALAAVIGTMWFQKFQLAEKRYSFFVRFDDVGGLVAGDPVFVNGVERGRVNAIDLRSDRVVVEMAIREGVSIPSDSRVSLQAVGIMGERQVTIRRGTDTETIAPGDTLDGALLMGLGEVMGETGDVIDEVAAATRSLREIAETLNADGKLREGVRDFAATSKNLRGMTEKNRGRLDRAIVRFERSSTMLDSLLTGHYSELDSSFASLGRAGGKFEATVDDLSAVSSDLKEITAQLRAGKGTAGRLLNDDTLIRRLEATSASLDTLLKDLREHPGRYVKFSLF